MRRHGPLIAAEILRPLERGHTELPLPLFATAAGPYRMDLKSLAASVGWWVDRGNASLEVCFEHNRYRILANSVGRGRTMLSVNYHSIFF